MRVARFASQVLSALVIGAITQVFTTEVRAAERSQEPCPFERCFISGEYYCDLSFEPVGCYFFQEGPNCVCNTAECYGCGVNQWCWDPPGYLCG